LTCLTFIAACNGIDFYLRAFVGLDDHRLTFITMNLLSIATLAALAIMFEIVGEVTGLSYPRFLRLLFGAQSLVVYVACMTVALFGGPPDIDAGAGYRLSALDGVLCMFVAGSIALARRARLPAKDRRYATACVVVTFAWLIVDTGNELFLWTALFGVPQLAMSPFFLIILSGFVIARSATLLAASPDGNVVLPSPGPALSPSSDTRRWELSEREREVLEFLAAGLENAAISERLFISTHTVKNHVSNIYRKSGARNRLELIRMLSDTPSAPLDRDRD